MSFSGTYNVPHQEFCDESQLKSYGYIFELRHDIENKLQEPILFFSCE